MGCGSTGLPSSSLQWTSTLWGRSVSSRVVCRRSTMTPLKGVGNLSRTRVSKPAPRMYTSPLGGASAPFASRAQSSLILRPLSTDARLYLRPIASQRIRQSTVLGLSLIGKALSGPGRQPDSTHSIVVKKLIRDRMIRYEFGKLLAVARKFGDVALSGAYLRFRPRRCHVVRIQGRLDPNP